MSACSHCGSSDPANDGEHFTHPVMGRRSVCLNLKDSRR